MGKKIQLEEKDIRKLRASINRLVKLVDCLPNTKESTYARGTIQTLQLDIDRYLKKYA